MSLSLRGLTVRQGGATLIEGITLDIAPARLTGLIGVNGAGKSTLMRAALGLIPAQGTSDLAALPLARRARRAAWLPQSREVAWPIPVAELVRLGRPWGPARGAGDAAGAEALAAVGAAHLAGRIATGLSGASWRAC
ncbi:ATP-binding cassette domain-containing protein [Paracoccus contaminans]|uniref:ATP-binding cassette domain-containing protein n=1 Tax=Paracoccus contaminans TaxID=1945662 RepID=UPI001F0A45D9|nr:ATP-binding cassette domain-containing protein [Paracoccus contaminans]